jgi:hypothetical protein
MSNTLENARSSCEVTLKNMTDQYQPTILKGMANTISVASWKKIWIKNKKIKSNEDKMEISQICSRLEF